MVTLFLIIGLYAGNLEYFVGPLSLRLPPLSMYQAFFFLFAPFLPPTNEMYKGGGKRRGAKNWGGVSALA
jgi:hypothetical protein